MEFFQLGSILDLLSESGSLMAKGMFSIKPPELITTEGGMIDSLFNYTTTMNIIFFVLVCIGLFGFSYKYAKKKNPRADYTYGNKKKDLIITGLLGAAVFFLIDMNITRLANDQLVDHFWKWPTAEEKPLRIEVLAQQWMWNFRYAGKDNLFNTEDDVLVNHDLVVPKGRKIEFRITSKDVIHSFYLPNTRLKVDAIPGRITRMWVKLNKDGLFNVACAEMCGTHHYQMKGSMTVLEPEKFSKWLNEAENIAINGNDKDNLDNYWGWKWENK